LNSGVVPISTIPSKWFERTNKQVSRWETTNEQVLRDERGISKPEQNNIYETIERNPAALVAQLAERRFRKSPLVYPIRCGERTP
jgi:hypothetical protein